MNSHEPIFSEYCNRTRDICGCHHCPCRNFTNLVARSSHGKNRTAFDMSFLFLKSIGSKLPERHAAAAATEHLAWTFYVICVLAFTDCSLHRTHQSVTMVLNKPSPLSTLCLHCSVKRLQPASFTFLGAKLNTPKTCIQGLLARPLLLCDLRSHRPKGTTALTGKHTGSSSSPAQR